MTLLTYYEVLSQARKPKLADQLRLLQDILSSLSVDAVVDVPGRRVLELKGLGREIWQDVDVERYVHEERASWHG